MQDNKQGVSVLPEHASNSDMNDSPGKNKQVMEDDEKDEMTEFGKMKPI